MTPVAEKEWFVFDGASQTGPIPESELRRQIEAGTVGAEHYVFTDGFDDWKLLSEATELTIETAPSGRRPAAPRVPMQEIVVAHNGKAIASGLLRNISITGVFFETKDHVFHVHDEIKITLKEGRGLGKPMHLKGVVVREANDDRYPKGYGLELKAIEEPQKEVIEDYIERHKKAS